ncbi:class I SAM-dependent methyltransferase [Adhaeribacter radiodurans]|uniref:Class I SAM-dependent methyltransferase n=1 Tax=Adhaeribacter radiodurans TaxID=2745197 RepID=A0A7L7L8Q3_9BACT|nr:class I SAM-dependent methyltransferase [Adhaeribacter radiodurans]QMU28905.1 class I SAM-dependent methyltransferase [Adhaeribacter radiodurans]
MKRYHLFEFEDLSWFPDILRQSMMDYLRFMISKISIYQPILPLMQEAMRHTSEPDILDLCSGGGGGIAGIQKELSKQLGYSVHITLTDKFPNPPAFELVKKQTDGAISYIAEPIDATNVPGTFTNFRTIFSAFHHFKPSLAKAILQDAARKKVPIGVFEGANKSWLEIALVLFIFPFIILIVTPFIKPFRFSRLFFTYLIPVLPLCIMWDGMVSILRLYSPEMLWQLTRNISSENYTWQAGKARHWSGSKVIYLIGYPD